MKSEQAQIRKILKIIGGGGVFEDPANRKAIKNRQKNVKNGSRTNGGEAYIDSSVTINAILVLHSIGKNASPKAPETDLISRKGISKKI